MVNLRTSSLSRRGPTRNHNSNSFEATRLRIIVSGEIFDDLLNGPGESIDMILTNIKNRFGIQIEIVMTDDIS